MKRTAAIILAGMLACACIYPYEMTDPEIDGRLVIEGDIVLGGMTEINVRYLRSLSSYSNADYGEKPDGLCWIEDNKKQVTACKYSEPGHYVFDTRSLSRSRQFRLCYTDSGTGHTYSSPLQSVNYAPKIEKLYYRTNDDDVDILLDLDGGKNGRYYRWDWTQTWEYTADFAPDCYFDTEDGSIKQYTMDGSPNYDYYYCWNEADYEEIGLGQVSSLQNNLTLKAQNVKTIERDDKKFSSLYRIEVVVRGISYGDLQYLQNMKTVSSTSADLFSPNPSDIVGNISSSDPDETVIGYINVCTQNVDTLYISASDVYVRPYYERSLFIPETDEKFTIQWFYDQGYRPTYMDSLTGICQWSPERCVDCRGYGGTKTKPEGWPTANE